jgi:hypothetical protein
MNHNYEFEPAYNPESDTYTCQKMIYMSLPIQIGDFDSESECLTCCHYLNDISKARNDIERLFGVKLEISFREMR